MIKKYNIENKLITLYLENPHFPMFIYNSYSDNHYNIIKECHQINCSAFNLICISNIDWNNEMTPYYEEIFNTVYNGNASEYLNKLTNIILPTIIKDNNLNPLYYCIVGYSLSGLFALYSLHHTNLFTRAISCSGSLWYPEFTEYIRTHQLNSVEKIYLSLGNKEKKTKNQLIQTVEDKTQEISNYYQSRNINTIFIKNEGNHFQDSDKRIAIAIKWIIDQDNQ